MSANPCTASLVEVDRLWEPTSGKKVTDAILYLGDGSFDDAELLAKIRRADKGRTSDAKITQKERPLQRPVVRGGANQLTKCPPGNLDWFCVGTRAVGYATKWYRPGLNTEIQLWNGALVTGCYFRIR